MARQYYIRIQSVSNIWIISYKSTLTRGCSLPWGILQLQLLVVFVELRCVHTQMLYGQSNKSGLRFSFLCLHLFPPSELPPFDQSPGRRHCFVWGNLGNSSWPTPHTQTRPIHRCCLSFFSNEVQQTNSLNTVALQCDTKTNSLDLLTRSTHNCIFSTDAHGYKPL